MNPRVPGKPVQVIAIIVMALAGFIFLLTGINPTTLLPSTEDGGTPGVVQPTPEKGAPETWWEVYFTDPPQVNNPDQWQGSIEEVLISHIAQAEFSIDIAAFEFNLTPVAEALLAAHQRGVTIRWITDDEHGIGADEEEGRGQFALLQKAGIEVKDDGRSALMHNKFIIIDGETVWTGSTNLTKNGIFRNNNNVLVIHSPELATIYQREFFEMWSGAFGPTSPSTVDTQALELEGSFIQVLFGSEDDVIDWLIPVINEAQSSIRFMAFSFTHQGLGEAMRGMGLQGVDVAGVFETRSSETDFSQLTPFYCQGFAVRQDGNPGTMHHKVIVIDGVITITGSLNFSNNANTSNDENVIVIVNPEIAGRYLEEFDFVWAEGHDADPKDLTCP